MTSNGFKRAAQERKASRIVEWVSAQVARLEIDPFGRQGAELALHMVNVATEDDWSGYAVKGGFNVPSAETVALARARLERRVREARHAESVEESIQ